MKTWVMLVSIILSHDQCDNRQMRENMKYEQEWYYLASDPFGFMLSDQNAERRCMTGDFTRLRLKITSPQIRPRISMKPCVGWILHFYHLVVVLSGPKKRECGMWYANIYPCWLLTNVNKPSWSCVSMSLWVVRAQPLHNGKIYLHFLNIWIVKFYIFIKHICPYFGWFLKCNDL